ncbi:MAG: putative sulfate exporter family transporter [Bacteroidales bacterium]|nr:putative sulfate exporter family transporter [Bacteroidales bacterium]MBN2750004.1 putative sulfate exporter family transporter [Bacteroidales bacterium]
MSISKNAERIVWVSLFALCFLPVLTAPIALFIGIALSLLGFKPTFFSSSKITSLLLQGSVVLMGFGMNLSVVLQTTQAGFAATAISVVTTILVGVALGYLLKVDGKTAMLISCGTAICGGSAIAAVSPVIRAKEGQISFALMVVFLLNSVALFLFPFIGHLLNMSQEAFGFWAAIAIHDTSSVVGAGSAFGEQALQVATTVKLTRALWIIPMSLVLALVYQKDKAVKIKIPWFIALFVAAIAVAYFFPSWSESFVHLSWLGKRGMVVALLLIGNSISVVDIRKVGLGSFVMGILLWLMVSTASFFLLR